MTKKSNKSRKGIDTRLISRLYVYVEPFKWFLVLALFLILLISYLGPLRPYLTQIAVDDYIQPGDIPGLLRIVFLFFGVLVAESILMMLNTYLTRWVGQNALYSLRNAVFEKIQSLHVQFFDRNPIGRLITRTTSDIEALSELLSSGVVNIIGDLMRIIFIMAFMFSMSWELTLVSLATLPILFYSTMLFKAKVRVAFLNVRDQIAKMHSFIQEHINGINIVQLFGREKKEAERFEVINQGHTQAYIKTIFYFSIFWPLVEVLASVAMALVVWYGGARVLLDDVSFGVLLAFIQYVRLFFLPIRDLADKFNTLQSALASSERIFNVLDTDNKIVDPAKPVEPGKPIKANIEFDKVWFKYNQNEDHVLRDINYTARHGEVTAIVGATGSGKTTMTNLLMRFYDVSSGSIKLDGVDIRNYRLDYLRSHFGLVMQDNALFSGSILENITLGDPSITREKVQEAAELVQADRFIQKLPGTYDYVLQERGTSLSMGQRQLICFVRAMVYDPHILILDEATSSVDSETETLVNEALEVLMKGRTSIVIAHRLSTIQYADNILVMHKGKIREMGTHEELLTQKDGIYRRLYELQYKDQTIATG
ncbi:MAG: ABC transporter ATP-binding protein [Balneolales bacterium]